MFASNKTTLVLIINMMKAYYKKKNKIYKVSDKCATTKYGLRLVCREGKGLGDAVLDFIIRKI